MNHYGVFRRVTMCRWTCVPACTTVLVCVWVWVFVRPLVVSLWVCARARLCVCVYVYICTYMEKYIYEGGRTRCMLEVELCTSRTSVYECVGDKE